MSYIDIRYIQNMQNTTYIPQSEKIISNTIRDIQIKSIKIHLQMYTFTMANMS